MTNENEKTQVAIIGAGPGGYPAAFLAADLGLDVMLIDPEEFPGGVCLYRGCIPSKALLHAARVVTEAGQAADWGISYPKPDIDVGKLRAWKDGVVEKFVSGLGQLSKMRKVKYIRGRASFTGPRTLEIIKTNGDTQKLSFEYAVISTGSRPAGIPGINVTSPHILDSTSALDLPSVPKSMLIVGGGYIGLELGTVYAALGTEITVAEMSSGLMPGADRDLVRVLQKRIEGIYKAVMLETKVTSLKQIENGILATVEKKGDKPVQMEFDRVLVSVGRKPNSEGLGLENTTVEKDAKGFIKVDEYRRTREPNIFAIGDVAGEPMLAHKATHEGRVVAEVLAGKKSAFEPNAIPAVVFTDPEIAWCGLTETEARERKIPFTIARFPWAASGRASTLDRPDGVTKLVLEPDTGRVLGVGIAGVGAGELISEGVLAVEMGALAGDMALSIHPHPTLSETFMEAAESFVGSSTHFYKTKKS
ncbi:MAG: dihydrolipoyl dehydrogenase [Candidatus Dadabacteria bacterium]|nr:dihydrolipoyl dehydrogenase [Candidatus Dadabacteria bacterium]